MFAGHLGAGLALKKIDKKTNLGWFFLSALFADILFWILTLAGIEKGIIPEDYNTKHFLTFVYPYSHSLISTIILSLITFFAARLFTKDNKTSFAISLGILSHFILDLIVHIPDLPLISNDSVKIGFGLWNNILIASIAEFLITISGLYIYLKATKPLTKAGKFGIPVLIIIIAIISLTGQMFSPKPENINQAALSSLTTIAMVIILSFWLDKKRT